MQNIAAPITTYIRAIGAASVAAEPTGLDHSVEIFDALTAARDALRGVDGPIIELFGNIVEAWDRFADAVEIGAKARELRALRRAVGTAGMRLAAFLN